MIVLLLLAIAVQQPTASQQPLDLLRALDSPEWQVRSSAISHFSILPVAELPPGFAAKAIALLEREAVDSAPGRHETGEGYGEYVISLVEAVLRLRDPHSIRGMALLGIQTSREAQEFVASQGAGALPYLDEAWRDPDAREAVGETWGYLLTTYTSRLLRGDRLQIMRRVFDADTVDSQAFVNAADDASLTMATPVVDHIAATDEGRIVRAVAAEVSARLRAKRDSLTPGALVNQLSEALEALCLRASDTRGRECTSLAAALRADSLPAFARSVNAGFRQHVWRGSERAVLADNAFYIMARRSR